MNSKNLTQCMISATAAVLLTAGVSFACIVGPSDVKANCDCGCPPPVSGCRMTGGHVAMANVDSTFENPESGTKYTTGGQIGAPNNNGCADNPPSKSKCVNGSCTIGGQTCSNNGDCIGGPWGDWEHNHHSGPDDSGSVDAGAFSFHSGTAAAPDGSFIMSIICADPGWCAQARPAPNKQIFWEGTGVFHNMKGNKNEDLPLPNFEACDNQPKVWSKTGGTLHYYRAHVGDFGEPAGIRQKPLGPDCTWRNTCNGGQGGVSIASCDLENGSCNMGSGNVCISQVCQDCPDWYEIEISCDEKKPGEEGYRIAYKVAHHITQGNFQLHPPVGDSCQTWQ